MKRNGSLGDLYLFVKINVIFKKHKMKLKLFENKTKQTTTTQLQHFKATNHHVFSQSCLGMDCHL